MRFARNVNKKRLLHKEKSKCSSRFALIPPPLHPLQFECFRDGNIATAQARNSENMSAQGFVPATRAGKNPFVRTGTGYSIFIYSPDDDLSIPNSFLTTANLIVKRCAKRNKFAERGSYQMKAGKAHGFNRGMIGRQLRFSWNKIRAEEAHCVSGGGVYAFFKRSDYVQSVNIYSAFLLEHIDTESLQYNMETFNSAFPVFLEMHENTKQRLQAVGSSLPASIGF